MDYDYSQDLPQPGDNILARLSGLADQAKEAEAEIERLEKLLTKAKADHRDIIQKLLPELMEEAGQKDCTTASGRRLQLQDVLRASIPKERVIEAHTWLRKNKLASIIKTVVIAQFGRDEEAKARKVLADLRKINPKAEKKEAVHPQTLQATLRELLTEGIDVPLDLFGAVLQKEVKISEKKK